MSFFVLGLLLIRLSLSFCAGSEWRTSHRFSRLFCFNLKSMHCVIENVDRSSVGYYIVLSPLAAASGGVHYGCALPLAYGGSSVGIRTYRRTELHFSRMFGSVSNIFQEPTCWLFLFRFGIAFRLGLLISIKFVTLNNLVLHHLVFVSAFVFVSAV